MNQLPPHRGSGLVPMQPETPTLYYAPDGTAYQVHQSVSGQITFTPLEQAQPAQQHYQPIYIQATEPQRSSQRDPLMTALIVLGVVLGIVGLAWFIGFMAGRSGQQVVVVPRSPVCSTYRSSFLFWSREEKECQ